MPRKLTSARYRTFGVRIRSRVKYYAEGQFLVPLVLLGLLRNATSPEESLRFQPFCKQATRMG